MTTGNFRKSRYRGVERTNAQSQYVAIACNLVRMAKLSLGPPATARITRRGARTCSSKSPSG